VDGDFTDIATIQYTLQNFDFYRLLKDLLPDAFVETGSAVAVNIW
jgi:hypothetical protein